MAIKEQGGSIHLEEICLLLEDLIVLFLMFECWKLVEQAVKIGASHLRGSITHILACLVACELIEASISCI